MKIISLLICAFAALALCSCNINTSSTSIDESSVKLTEIPQTQESDFKKDDEKVNAATDSNIQIADSTEETTEETIDISIDDPTDTQNDTSDTKEETSTPIHTEDETEPAEEEITTQEVIPVSIEAAVNGSFYLGDILVAQDFSIKVTMSDGSVVPNPPGFAAYPLVLSEYENRVIVTYMDLSTEIFVSAQQPPEEPETTVPSMGGEFKDPASLAGGTINGLSVVGTAMNWLGTVYSQDPNSGIDCSRLVKATLAACGISRKDLYGDPKYNYLPGYTGQWRDVNNSTCFYINGLMLHFPVSYYNDIAALSPDILNAPGNVIMYEPASGSSKEWHMAFTIGRFSSREEVIDWLVSVYGSQGFDKAYFESHPELVYDYGNGYTYWRIHSGQDANFVRIDNGTEGHYKASGWFLYQVNQ